MRDDRQEAAELRRSGKSYKEIVEALRIPKATLSDWFSNENWSNEIKKKLIESSKNSATIRIVELNKVRGEHLRSAYEAAKLEARDELKRLKYNPLFIAGLMLYWGEGDKRTHYQVRLINTDPEMIRLFVLFLTNACGIPLEKIRGAAIIYPDLEDLACRKYWSDVAGLPLANFNKSTVIQGRHKTRRLPFGMGQIFVSSTYFKTKVLEWLQLLPQELMGRAYYESML